MNRDAQGRPIKPPMIGRAYTPDDLRELKEALSYIANEEGRQYAMQLLDHGFVTTTLQQTDYDDIKSAIEESPI